METLDALYTAAGSLKGRDAMKRFLKDLLTESERIMLGRRILVARALLMGKTHDEIVQEMKVGKDTTARISKWLDDQLPGYEEAIEGMEKELKDRQEKYEDKKLYATNAFYRLKKKYPMHFLLFPKPKLKD
jgi:uncharacterized protein YerC